MSTIAPCTCIWEPLEPLPGAIAGGEQMTQHDPACSQHGDGTPFMARVAAETRDIADHYGLNAEGDAA